MVFAYEQIRHLPRVRLTGFVKTETKKKWECMFHNAYRRDSEQLKYVEAEKKRISSLPLTEV